MKKIILLVLLQATWTTGFAQNLSFKFGIAFKRPDLDVRWNVPTNLLPSNVWVYHLLPRKFSPTVLSNLMALGPFTGKEVIRSNANEILFKKTDNLTTLWVSWRLGAIEYEPANPFGPTNLARDVPEEAQVPQLTTNFLKEIGIDVSEIEKKADGAPDFHVWSPLTMYPVNRVVITNIGFRAVNFRRSVDGATFVGNGAGGNCEIQFGEHGKPSKIRLSWRNLERQNAFPVAKPATLIKWIREGKAVQGMVRMDGEPINCKTAKSLTINQAELCYYAGDPFSPSDWLMPFAALWTSVDTGHGSVDVEIDCPVIDER
jgi:hypothetical protein